MNWKFWAKNKENLVMESANGNLFTHLRNEVAGSMDSKFAKDIFTQTKRSMHDDFVLCKKAYRTNALVHTSVETMTDMLKGDNCYIDSNNDVLKIFVEDHYFYDSGFLEGLNAAIKDAIITGNGYIEVCYNADGKVSKYLPFFASEDIYIDYDYNSDKVKRYIQRVYNTQMGKSFVLNTPLGPETIVGNEIPVENFIHIRLGYNTYAPYGRSDVASILDDIRILDVMERAIAVYSKYKAVPKKYLFPEYSDSEERLSEEEMKIIADKIKNMADFESPIGGVKLSSLDLTASSGEISNLVPFIDYLKRKVTVCMAPEFLIHGQDTNRATSREQKQAYYLRLDSKREPLEMQISSLLRLAVAELERKELIGELKFHFGEFDIELPQEFENKILNRYKTGLITLAQARQELDLPEMEGTDLFVWELPNQSSMQFPTNQNEQPKEPAVDDKK